MDSCCTSYRRHSKLPHNSEHLRRLNMVMESLYFSIFDSVLVKCWLIRAVVLQVYCSCHYDYYQRHLGVHIWILLRTYSSYQGFSEENMGRFHRWRLSHRSFRVLRKDLLHLSSLIFDDCSCAANQITFNSHFSCHISYANLNISFARSSTTKQWDV